MLGGLVGLFSLETSQIPNAVSHQVRRRLVVYNGGQVDGNSLPRFGSLSGARAQWKSLNLGIGWGIRPMGRDITRIARYGRSLEKSVRSLSF